MKSNSTAALAVLLLTGAIACAQTPDKVVANVNGESLTMSQIESASKAEMEDLDMKRQQYLAGYERDRFGILERKLREIVADRLLDAEAKKRSTTKAELVKAEIQDKTAAASDAEADAFYDANRNRIRGTKDEARASIVQYLSEQKRDAAYDAFITLLMKQYNAAITLDPMRVAVATEGFPSRGPSDAAVTVVEFSDFECPFCSSLHTTMKQVEARYAGKMRLVYRQFPLNQIHPNAQKAAEASLCAFEQKKFWEIHDLMFENQKELTVPALKNHAARLGMDGAAFASCLDSGKHAAAVRKEVADGVRAGVSGTPALFINGRFLSGAQPFEEIARVIDEELKGKQ